ncbi:MAG: glycoside hydrolase family 127 protein [Spirosomataceae bacterium]
MKKLFTFFLWGSTILSASAQNFYPYTPVPFNQVKLKDEFWYPKIEVNRTSTIPWSFQQCQETGRIKNFEQAAARQGKFCGVYVFDDTDVYKTMEGAAYSLQVTYDAKLDAYLDSLITLIGQAQEEDGYLYTVRTMGDKHHWIGKERYEKEHEHSHELYNAGHFYEAATAHYWATGKRSMLNLAIKNADHLLTVFGPGKRSVAPGHQVIEMGLVKMYRATGKKEYLELAQFFIDARGKRIYPKKIGTPGATVWETGEYWQDHAPAIEQTEAIGHAVRATYLYAGMADVAALTQNEAYIKAIHTLWENAAGKKTYVTGGIGASGGWEGFGPDYDLPNEDAYCETCAGIGNVYWNHRMFLLTGNGKYMDLVERTLYNGILGGIGLDGKSFYYANPMEYRLENGQLSGENKRSPWFTCSCCPSNICRFMPSIPGYIYAQQGNRAYINLYMTSSTQLDLAGGQKVMLSQETQYPWAGRVKVQVETPAKKGVPFALHLRVPGFAGAAIFPTNLYEASATQQPIRVQVNGAALSLVPDSAGYLVISRTWKSGDVVVLDMPMETKTVTSHPKVKANVNRIAVQRGPIMYCAEFPDNGGRTATLVLPTSQPVFQEKFESKLLGGIMTLQTPGKVIDIQPNDVKTIERPIQLIPYFARSNRGVGEMKLWFPTKITNVQIE